MVRPAPDPAARQEPEVMGTSGPECCSTFVVTSGHLNSSRDAQNYLRIF